jgi:hypothetical protein
VTGGCAVGNTQSPGERPDYLRQLSDVREDPEVKNLARRRAGDRDLAEDALQETYCIMAQVPDPERIEDLKSYFCRVLIHTIYHLLGQLRPVPIEDFERLPDVPQGNSVGQSLQRPFDDTFCTHQVAGTWLGRLDNKREAFRSGVPGRSPDPDRYRELIVRIAERVLIAAVTGDMSDADSTPALCAAYPEWFAPGRVTTDNAYQRVRRARSDVGALLRSVVNRDELYP